MILKNILNIYNQIVYYQKLKYNLFSSIGDVMN